MNLLIGCPVAHREWILPAWFEHVHAACSRPTRLHPGFVFVGDKDDPSHDVIDTYAPDATFIHVRNQLGYDARCWQRPGRYAHMVELRNLLLGAVRALAPDVFISVDSDILLHPQALVNLIRSLERFDAVGGRCYMTATTVECPSNGTLDRDNKLRRSDVDGVISTQVIMAIKAMSPAAYAVDYREHLYGEDIGWSLAASEAGLRLGWDGRSPSKHVLEPWMLTEVDPRVGF